MSSNLVSFEKLSKSNFPAKIVLDTNFILNLTHSYTHHPTNNNVSVCVDFMKSLVHDGCEIFIPQIVINEFLVEPDSDQEVELYNSGNSSVDVSGWFIDDDGGSQKYTIPSGTVLTPGEFKSFKSGLFNLNRTNSDTVRLINGSEVVDSKSYDQSPGAGKSLGRKPDGSDSWLVFDNPLP